MIAAFHRISLAVCKGDVEPMLDVIVPEYNSVAMIPYVFSDLL